MTRLKPTPNPKPRPLAPSSVNLEKKTTFDEGLDIFLSVIQFFVFLLLSPVLLPIYLLGALSLTIKKIRKR